MEIIYIFETNPNGFPIFIFQILVLFYEFDIVVKQSPVSGIRWFTVFVPLHVMIP